MKFFKNKLAGTTILVAIFLVIFYTVIAAMGQTLLLGNLLGTLATPFRYGFRAVGNAFGGFADYVTEFRSLGKENEQMAERIVGLLTTAPLVISKKSKSGEREVDITSMISHVSGEYCTECGAVLLKARLACGQTENLNASVVVGVLKDKLGILCGDPTLEYCSIRRLGFYTADGNPFA